jgi:hypothetical protein
VVTALILAYPFIGVPSGLLANIVVAVVIARRARLELKPHADIALAMR